MTLAEPLGICFASAIDFNTFILFAFFRGVPGLFARGYRFFAGS